MHCLLTKTILQLYNLIASPERTDAPVPRNKSNKQVIVLNVSCPIQNKCNRLSAANTV